MNLIKKLFNAFSNAETNLLIFSKLITPSQF